MPLSTNTFRKTPDESILYSAQFAELLDDGETLSSIVEVTVTPDDGEDPLNVSQNQAINGTTVTFRATGGDDGVTYYVAVEVLTNLGNEYELICPLVVEELPDAWSSRQELDDMFGAANVSLWADLTNDEDADEIARRVEWSIAEATADIVERLVDGGAPTADLLEEGYTAPRSLRLAVTRKAGVLLYESRGVKDSTSEDGTNRLSVHKKEYERFVRQVLAGQRMLSSAAGVVPSVVTHAQEDGHNDVVVVNDFFFEI